MINNWQAIRNGRVLSLNLKFLAATLCQVPRSVVVLDRLSPGIDFFGPGRSS